jgi:hypothetical protein
MRERLLDEARLDRQRPQARAAVVPAPRRPPGDPRDPASAEVLRLQRLAGNRAVQRAIRQSSGPPALQRWLISRTVKIGDERVIVKNAKEKAEAEAIIKRIKDTYGLELSSKTTIAGIKGQYTNVKKKVLDKLKSRAWRMIELRSLERALKVYAPILGAARASSTRAGAGQEVTSVGKVAQAIDTNKPAGKLDTTTLGEYFSSKKNMGLFKASEGYKVDFPDEGDQLTGTFVHEIAHGLLSYAIGDYIKATAYWSDRYTKLPKSKRLEAPVTGYGKTNAAEDLCESAMMYFVKPDRLKSNCPKRYAFMAKIGKDWVPPPAQAPQVKPGKSDEESVKSGATGPGEDLLDEILSSLSALFSTEPEQTPAPTGAQ